MTNAKRFCRGIPLLLTCFGISLWFGVTCLNAAAATSIPNYPVVPEDFQRKHNPPIILAVDGISLAAQSRLFASWVNYLKPELDHSRNIKAMGATVEPFPWSGDTNDTQSALNALKTTYIPAFIARAKRENRKLVIVAHSWGGVLSYLALNELSGRFNQGDVLQLITLGTPLNAQLQGRGLVAGPWAARYLPGDLHKPEIITSWTNYWIRSDNISGSIPVAQNVQLPGGDHSAYYANKEFLETVGAEIAAAIISSSSTQTPPIKDATEGNSFTSWLSSAAYQEEFNNQLANKCYPAIVEGTNQNGESQFRATFAPFPSTSFGFYSYHGMTHEYYQQKNTELTSRGFTKIWEQQFTDAAGIKNFQATWIKQ